VVNSNLEFSPFLLPKTFTDYCYKDFLKRGENEKALQLWKVVYEKSPAADGKRISVYSDGIKLYTEKFNAERNKKRKKEFAEIIYRLMEEQKKCYPDSEVISPSKEIMEFRSETERMKKPK
jgi:hypothetical protein